MPKLNKAGDSWNERKGETYLFVCPGCDQTHQIWVSHGSKRPSGPCWTFNGDMEKPTFSPSLRVQYHKGLETEGTREKVVCHSFIRDGNMEYCGDSTHNLAGQTVEIPDWNKYWKEIDDGS